MKMNRSKQLIMGLISAAVILSVAPVQAQEERALNIESGDLERIVNDIEAGTHDLDYIIIGFKDSDTLLRLNPETKEYTFLTVKPGAIGGAGLHNVDAGTLGAAGFREIDAGTLGVAGTIGGLPLHNADAGTIGGISTIGGLGYLDAEAGTIGQ